MKTIHDDTRLSAYLFDELSLKEKVKLERELAENPELAAEMEEIRCMESKLREALEKEVKAFLLTEEQQQLITNNIGEKQGKPDFWPPIFTTLFNRPGLSFSCAFLLVSKVVFVVKDMVLVPALVESKSVPKHLEMAVVLSDTVGLMENLDQQA